MENDEAMSKIKGQQIPLKQKDRYHIDRLLHTYDATQSSEMTLPLREYLPIRLHDFDPFLNKPCHQYIAIIKNSRFSQPSFC